tara:strand:- start:307 stop:531 length:225 start_codon:yes stop_codon:yes gene_type:complete
MKKRVSFNDIVQVKYTNDIDDKILINKKVQNNDNMKNKFINSYSAHKKSTNKNFYTILFIFLIIFLMIILASYL